MSFHEFMFSRQMQLILFLLSCLSAFLLYYCVTNIILKIYAQKVSTKRKVVFVLIYGVFLNTIMIYIIYLLGNMVSFSPMVYLLVTVANPIYAMLLYLCGVKILQLSPYRSVHILSNAFLYFVAVNRINQFIGFTFFAQPGAHYNYLLDVFAVVGSTAVDFLLYLIMLAVIDRFCFVIKQADQLNVESLNREVFYSFLKACFVYSSATFLPIYIPSSYLHLVLAFIFALMIVNSVLADARKAAQIDVSNRDSYINNLVDTVDQFRGVKHDINNMIMTYEGYISLGDMDHLKEYHSSLLQVTSQANQRLDISNRMNENPTLIGLLNEKLDYAESCSVSIDINLTCDLDLYIRDIDICCSLGGLLDNAIEAAATATSHKVLFLIEKKSDDTKLIVIKNSTLDAVEVSKLTQGMTTKEGHSGMGLARVRQALGKYGNCTLNLTYYDHSFTAYVTIAKV